MIELKDRSGLAQIEADMTHLCNTIGNRLAGWPGEERAALWMVERCEELGLASVARLAYPLRRWRLVKGELVALGDQERKIACVPCTHAASTPPEGVEGDLAAFEPMDYENGLKRSDLDGKIGLFHGSYGESAKVFAELHDSPLKALIFIDTRLQTPWPIANGMGEKFMTLVKKPMAYISLMDAWELAKTGVRRIRLTSVGETEDATSWNVVADLPGDDPQGKIIVVCGHLDSVAIGVGADDNAAGIAATLECARRLKTVPRRHTLRFVGFGAEEQLSVGSWRYVKNQAHDLDRIAFVCNFDAIAAWRGISKIMTTGTEALDSFYRRIVEDKYSFARVAPDVSPYQDAYPFACKGIPGVWITRETHPGTYWYHHSVHNNVENCSMEQIARTAEVSCDILRELASIEEWPFERAISSDLAKEIERFRLELFE